jgi:hypothetical protein
MNGREAAAGQINALFTVIEGDAVVRADFIAGLVDELIGTDPHAILDNIPGLSADLTETMSDGLISAIKAAALRRFQGGE